MRKKFILLLFAAVSVLASHAELTLERCLEAAHDNFPLVQQYGIIDATRAVSLSEINKYWLPAVSLNAQATIQNVVPAFPESLESAMQMLGQEVKGLNKFQYKAGAELRQTIWDGGATRSQRAVTRAQSDEQAAQVDVQMYALNERVEAAYFGILLIDEQIAQTRVSITVLEANLERLQAMLKNGVAMQSDVDMVEAQLLTARQNLTRAEGNRRSSLTMLSLLTGLDTDNETLARPADTMPDRDVTDRPELKYYDARLRTIEAQRKAITPSLMPKAALFGQAYWGYPGYNYFESMMTGKSQFNAMAGVNVSWNIDAFYTKRNKEQRLDQAALAVETEREVFLYNNRIQSAAQFDDIVNLRNVMADDQRIVDLRSNVRQAAESQLVNGVIDATTLLTKIADEEQAELTARLHEIQLLQNIYKLKNTLNR